MILSGQLSDTIYSPVEIIIADGYGEIEDEWRYGEDNERRNNSVESHGSR